MGTRSLTRINTSDGSKIINLYRQMDGYPSGHGQKLFEFLDGFEIVNGISSDTPAKAANGAGCLAAQMVAHFKTGIGGFYLFAPDEDDFDQDYEYIVTVTEAGFSTGGALAIQVLGYEGVAFDGTVADFGAFCSRPE